MPIIIVKGAEVAAKRKGLKYKPKKEHHSSDEEDQSGGGGDRGVLRGDGIGDGAVSMPVPVDLIEKKRRKDRAKAALMRKNLTKTHYLCDIPDALDGLDFKVYHIINQPAFGSFHVSKPPPPETKLVGDPFYKPEEKDDWDFLPFKSGREQPEEEKEKKKETEEASKLSVDHLLHKVEVLRYYSDLFNTKKAENGSLLNRFNANFAQARNVKAGQHSQEMSKKTQQETLEWALLHVGRNEGNLAKELVAIATDVETYIRDLSEIQASGKLPPAGYVPTFKTMFNFEETMVVAKPSQSDASNGGKSGGANGKGLKQGPSLLHQLEKLELEKRHDFIEAITERPPHIGALGGNEIMQSSSTISPFSPERGGLSSKLKGTPNPRLNRFRMQSSSSIMTPTSHVASNHNSNNALESNNSIAATMHPQPPSALASSSAGSGRTHKNSHPRMKISDVDAISQQQLMSPTSQSQQNNVVVVIPAPENEEDDVSNSTPTVADDGETMKAPRVDPLSKKRPDTTNQATPTGPQRFTNATIFAEGAAQQTVNIHNAVTKKFESSVAFIKAEVTNAEKRLTSLQDQSAKLLVEVEKKSDRVTLGWEHFLTFSKMQEKEIVSTCHDKEFQRGLFMQMKANTFNSIQRFQPGRLATQEMEIVGKEAKRKYYFKTLDNIARTAWFAKMIIKFREHVKRPVPSSCFKFISALLHLIMLGWPFTTELFYVLLERTINVTPEDHLKGIVHKTLMVCRENTGIDHEAFLAYLEEHSIQPCPELLAEIRKLKKKARKKAAAGKMNTTVKVQKSLMTISESADQPGNPESGAHALMPGVSNAALLAPVSEEGSGLVIGNLSSVNLAIKTKRKTSFAGSSSVMSNSDSMSEFDRASEMSDGTDFSF